MYLFYNLLPVFLSNFLQGLTPGVAALSGIAVWNYLIMVKVGKGTYTISVHQSGHLLDKNSFGYCKTKREIIILRFTHVLQCVLFALLLFLNYKIFVIF